MPPAPLDPLVGSSVGSFRIQRLLGRGGMGSVYLAEHPVIGSKVAIKFLHESLSSSAEAVGRFYDEARAVNLIGHENIVGIYDLALLPPARYYIVMEYLEGAPLSARLRERRPDPAVTLEVLLQLADALRAAHERGVVHRDLKPDNVFLLRRRGSDAFVKLVDFGIAKLADAAGPSRTLPGFVFGTPEYMAPEQCDGAAVDGRTDVYALGVMAYELATGRVPFTGSAVAQILLAQVRDAPVPPRQLDPSIPPSLERAILRALAKRPADRHPDMATFAAELEQARRDVLSGPAMPAAAAPPAATPAPAAEALEVRGLAGGARRLGSLQVTRGGLFLCDDRPPPPLFSRLTLVLPGEGGAPVEVPAEVVRHVSPADAARWGMPAGFAVQLAAPGPRERSAVEALAARRAAPTRPPERPTAAAARALLDDLEQRAAAGPYELLGARPDEGFPELRERARDLRARLEALRPWLPPPEQASRVPALLARLDAASELLGSPAERLGFDLRRGNVAGVAHCVTAGLPAELLEARRQAFLAEHPGARSRAEQQLARARMAEKLGNPAGAASALEAALSADPLDLTLHRELRAARRRLEG